MYEAFYLNEMKYSCFRKKNIKKILHLNLFLNKSKCDILLKRVVIHPTQGVLKWSSGMLHLGVAPFSPFRGLDARHVANKHPRAEILN